MAAYYNEIDPYAAQWLRNLIAAGHIAAGDVDERSIEDVTPDDLRNYTQCHFFAGIAVWSYALRRAGWSDDKPVWTGSCPCQPFSAAGQGGGFDDERHLWPHFHYLIEQCRPPVVFGEQVASKDGLGWFDLVQADLEGANYAATAVDICAAGVGAPHIRQRLFWVAHSEREQRQKRVSGSIESYSQNDGGQAVESARFCLPSGVEYSNSNGWERGVSGREDSQREAANGSAGCDSTVIRLDNSECIGRNQGREGDHSGDDGQQSDPAIKNDWPHQVNGFWQDADWLFCHDGKWRPVKPGLKPLANGITARVGRLRAYGNAICAEVAETFVGAYMAAQEQK
ncbi:DNA cytosine methyltransferase [Hafnia alvei]|uniref:DNA cytosine methyltransferase n=1 Tax=Hafnia alvei TaxID=569 RepID=UPI00345DE650